MKLMDIERITGIPQSFLASYVASGQLPFAPADTVSGGAGKFSSNEALAFSIYAICAGLVEPQNALAAAARWMGGPTLTFPYGTSWVTVDLTTTLAAMAADADERKARWLLGCPPRMVDRLDEVFGNRLMPARPSTIFSDELHEHDPIKAGSFIEFLKGNVEE